MTGSIAAPAGHVPAKIAPDVPSTQGTTERDAIDDRILRVLARDGRITSRALADRVGLFPSATLRRVQAMERAGLIRGYRAVIDPERAGIGFTAYIAAGLNDHTKAGQEGFERALAEAPEVRECHDVTGSVEYLLHVEARDLAAASPGPHPPPVRADWDAILVIPIVS